jgi:phytoene dehydrogenase-like protein
VLEKRHIIGGAAVTEEIVPGFKFSRASYLLSLLRPQIMTDLELKKHGLKVNFKNVTIPSHVPVKDLSPQIYMMNYLTAKTVIIINNAVSCLNLTLNKHTIFS